MELLAIVRRIDTDGDANIVYSEFAEFTRPNMPAPRPVAYVPPPRPMSPYRAAATSPLKSSAAARSYSAERPRASGVSPSRMSPSRKPILMLHDEDQLIHALKEQCNLEAELETTKIGLANKSDFNVIDAFNIFDTNRNGQLTVHELQ